MAGEARRYILECVDAISSGVTTISATTLFDITQEFSGVTDTDTGSTFIYNSITLEELAELSQEDYEQRITDFFIFLDISTLNERNMLLTASTFIDGSCTGSILPLITIGFDKTEANSSIEFLLNATNVIFTAVTAVTNAQQFLASFSGTISANTFKNAIDSYLTINSIDSLYNTSIDTNRVTIEAVNPLSFFNFGTVTFINVGTSNMSLISQISL